MTRERIQEAILLCGMVGVVIIAIAMIVFPPPADELALEPLADRLDAADFDWDICFGDCRVSAEAFQEFLREQCEGGE